MDNFIIASSKPWHHAEFENISRHQLGTWFYVSCKVELEACLKKITPRYIFFLHWDWRVPHVIWQQHECVCFHMTDVPYGRGGSPLQNLILEGRTETKVTALRMEAEIDAGPIYAKRPMALNGRAEDIYLRAGEICWEIIQWMIKDNPSPVAQEGKVTHFHRRKPEQSHLPVEGGLSAIYDFIRMLDAPTYPPAFLDHGEFRMEFWCAELGDDTIEARVLIRRNKDKEVDE